MGLGKIVDMEHIETKLSEDGIYDKGRKWIDECGNVKYSDDISQYDNTGMLRPIGLIVFDTEEQLIAYQNDRQLTWMLGYAALTVVTTFTPAFSGDVNAGPSRTPTPAIAPGFVPAEAIEVTDDLIRAAMQDAPLLSQQSGGLSRPVVQRYVDMLLSGQKPPPIKVDGNIIVDGNHRYVAGRICGQIPPQTPWTGGRPDRVVPWDRINISDIDFATGN